MISITEIQNIAQSFISETPSEKVNQCGRLTSIMEFELEDRNISYNRIEGSVTLNNTSDPHIFLEIPHTEIKECSNGPVIVDVTIQQFQTQFANDPSIDVQTDISVKYDIPDIVGIYTPSDPEYSIYSK